MAKILLGPHHQRWFWKILVHTGLFKMCLQYCASYLHSTEPYLLNIKSKRSVTQYTSRLVKADQLVDIDNLPLFLRNNREMVKNDN